MPKRKRETYENGSDRVLQHRKDDVHAHLANCKRLLHRALKTAKGFERQKLGKRLKNATTEGKDEDKARISREIEVLKGLDLDKATNVLLYGRLLKIKSFAESECLPEEVRTAIPKPETTDDMRVASHNVTSGMFSMKPVKEVMEKVVSGMYMAMGIPLPAKTSKGKKTEAVSTKNLFKNSTPTVSEAVGDLGDITMLQESAMTGEELAWEGFSSEGKENNVADVEAKNEEEEEHDIEYGSLDEEQLSRYDALLGASSDEESFDEHDYIKHRTSQPTTRLSLSLSPSRSPSPVPMAESDLEILSKEEREDSESASESVSDVSPPPRAAKITKTKTTTPKPQPAQTRGSTFLPTLMGGYWSGSESEASDLEDDTAPPVRKNRPGQMARRAIWEKKYGTNAKHIKTGQGSVAERRVVKDGGWDAKRGASDGGRAGRGRRGVGRGQLRGGNAVRSVNGRRQVDSNSSRVTGENSIPVVAERGRGMGRKDDVGVLHPSWQAAKKAKEMKKTARFEGKKVTFD